MKFLSRAKAEKFLYACNYDFATANELSALCHFNFFFLMNIIERFGGNYKEACLYLRKFKEHQPLKAETTHCKAALGMLSGFKNDGQEALKYLSLFKDNVITASSFLSEFQNDTTKAKNFIEKFRNDGERANEYFKKFNDIHEANEFAQAFNSSLDHTLKFIQSFDNSKKAHQHLEIIKKECDEKADNFCGDNCKWIFDEKTKTLFIRGSRKMKDYEWKNGAPTTPWSSKRKQIENVVINEGITIGDGAFSRCSSLTSITIPDSVTKIGDGAFWECSPLTSITIPESVTSIGRLGFCGCSKLTSINIPKNVKEIGKKAFADCSNLSTITVDEENKYFKSVRNVLFTKDGTKLIRYASAKKETSYIIPGDVVVIGDSAFDACPHLDSITISNSVTMIGDYAFSCCSSLTTATLPKSFESQKGRIFVGCDKLTTINWTE